MYVRFVTTRQHPNTGVQIGIFQTSLLLPAYGQVADWDETRLAEIKRWFNDNLEKPERVSRSQRPNGHHSAVSWFKDTAHEHIARARDLAALLEANGIPTQMLTTDRPGYVVYEDDYQVAAEPFIGELQDRGI
jgi:hypothetical protein